MSRHKLPPHPMLQVARAHLRDLDPELRYTQPYLRQLDGPPGSPRFAVSLDQCAGSGSCAHGVADANLCSVIACPQRNTIRLLLSRKGDLIQVIRGHLRWENRQG